jgi:LmbE family N-acetylglucosaminyl deacetylase
MNVSKLGTIMGVWAHPDDEAYLSGGLMAMAADAGARVVCVTATRGELGTSEPEQWPPERLAALREAELARSLGVLGVTEHHWLGYRDGSCMDADPEEAVARLSAVIDRVRPDTVVTFGSDGHTGHPDHRAVSAWVDAAFHRGDLLGTRLLHAAVTHQWARAWSTFHQELSVFEDGLPATVDDDRLVLDLALDGTILARKVQALVAQASQTTGLISHLGAERYAQWVGRESFVSAEPVLGRRS